jgi:hypothetical protein
MFHTAATAALALAVLKSSRRVHRYTAEMPGTGARRQAARPGRMHARPSRLLPSSSSCVVRRVDVATSPPSPHCRDKGAMPIASGQERSRVTPTPSRWPLTRSPRTPTLVPLGERTAAAWPPLLGISPPRFPDKRKRHGLSAACPSRAVGAAPHSLTPPLPLTPKCPCTRL